MTMIRRSDVVRSRRRRPPLDAGTLALLRALEAARERVDELLDDVELDDGGTGDGLAGGTDGGDPAASTRREGGKPNA